MNIFFQGIGTLVAYNWAFPSKLCSLGEVKKIVLESSLLSFLVGGYYYWRGSREILHPSIYVHERLRGLTSFHSRLSARKYDLVHLNFHEVRGFHNFLACECPKIFTFHGSGLGLPNRSAKSTRLRKIAASVDIIVAVSNYAKKNMRELFRVDPVVIHHGVDISIFKPDISQNIARAKLGLPLTKKIVLWSNRLDQSKDLSTLLKAIPLIKHSTDDVLFVLRTRAKRSSPEAFASLRSLMRKMPGTIKLLDGWLTYQEMPLLFRSADVVVHTSLDEAFGLVLLEAMACGIPVVSANCATAPEILGDAGVYFSPGNPVDLAEKVEHVLLDCERRSTEKLGRQRVISGGFTTEDMARRYISLYGKLV